ncbi:expressed protein [Phakopsora pachyrhizi]|uniref:Expressed protein n=1 Tax=Phakopsora pachyrhizi TaxID=170000 RepID=A0AAV0BGL5_PHAPC|nr:expressed protein [Phakopsora pachyrhizi]
MDRQKLQSLSNLGLAIYPTNSSTLVSSPTLLYSSVTDDGIWRLTLIGTDLDSGSAFSREVWWINQWTLEELVELVPNLSSTALISTILLAFHEDDITITGYKAGQVSSLKVTIRSSQPDRSFTVTLNKFHDSMLDGKPHIPRINLLEIACQAYSMLNKFLKSKSSSQSSEIEENKDLLSKRSIKESIRNNVGENLQKNQLPLPLSLNRPNPMLNISNPSKKVRVQVTNGFLSSDESD